MPSKYTLVLLALALGTPLLAQHPIVPGVERLRSHRSSTPSERGVVLLSELSCTACHAAGGSGTYLRRRQAPDLKKIASRVTVSWLKSFLADPHNIKPGTLMPKWQPDADAATRESYADLLVHYLTSRSKGLAMSKTVASEAKITRGRQLFQSVGCVACHAPIDGRKTEVSNIPLGKLAHKMTVESLSAFLRNPQAVRPASRMPNLRLDDKEAEAIAMFLLREQVENPQAAEVEPPSRPGLAFDYYEIESAAMPDFDKAKPRAQGIVEKVSNKVPNMTRQKRYALRMHGDLKTPKKGVYTFSINSLGESRLLINGDVVIADGTKQRSGEVDLSKGQHQIEVEYFHFKGKQRLRLQWAGPDIKKRDIPPNALSNRIGKALIPLESPIGADAKKFGRNKTKVQRGGNLFVKLGCAACHEPAANKTVATPLARLDPDKPGSCLDANPTGGAVAFDLSSVQISELRSALKNRAWSKKPDSESQVRQLLAAFNCYACHPRDGIGGPMEPRENLFKTKISIDLGDEGRLPPTLDGVGDKLKPQVLAKILSDDEHHIRGEFMATRMPGFAGEIKLIAQHLIASDRKKLVRTPTVFSPEAVAAGKRLVGVTGFACVTCHNVNGDRSAAIPGIDIASTTKRLNRDWFHRYLTDPPTFRPGTRMPAFWAQEQSAFTDLLGGSSTRQMDAVWSYLSLGKSIPAPEGIQKASGRPKMELIPQDQPILHRSFMKDVSQRAILVGYPENLHVAFDAQSVRLAKVWRGRFFDASGVASGRTDRFYGPLGSEELLLPAPAFAVLKDNKSPWPTIGKGERNIGGDFLGYRFPKDRRPVFRYKQGGFEIQEQPIPILQPGGAVLKRSFVLVPGKNPKDLHYLAWRGKNIKKVAEHKWQSGGVGIELRIDMDHDVIIRPAGDQQEMLIFIAANDMKKNTNRFEEIIRW